MLLKHTLEMHTLKNKEISSFSEVLEARKLKTEKKKSTANFLLQKQIYFLAQCQTEKSHFQEMGLRHQKPLGGGKITSNNLMI